VAKEKRQPGFDDLDIPQDPLSKFNLGLDLANITRCGGRYHAAANRILKATSWAPYAKNRTATIPMTTNFSLNRDPTPF